MAMQWLSTLIVIYFICEILTAIGAVFLFVLCAVAGIVGILHAMFFPKKNDDLGPLI